MIEQYRQLHEQVQSRATYLLEILDESGEDYSSLGFNAWTCICQGYPEIEVHFDFVTFKYDTNIPYEPEETFDYLHVPDEFLLDTPPSKQEVLDHYLGKIEKEDKKDYVKRVASALQLLDNLEGDNSKKYQEYLEIAEKVVEANWRNLK